MKNRNKLVLDIPAQNISLYQNKFQQRNTEEGGSFSPALVVPLTQHTLFDDPEESVSTPTTQERFSSDTIMSFMLDFQDKEDAVELVKKQPNRSRASTRGSMDNIVLDSFFDE